MVSMVSIKTLALAHASRSLDLSGSYMLAAARK
uniref:Uncharacterized protein n=1 Tax=Rhizophora mucronata TaxID=61149 RepID=A0A2P2QRT9_RHIMU